MVNDELLNEVNTFYDLDYNELLEIDAGNGLFYYIGYGLGKVGRWMIDNKVYFVVV